MGLFKKWFSSKESSARKQPNFSLTPEELDSLFTSPEFVQKYHGLSQEARDQLLARLTPSDLRRYIEQGKAVREKMNKELGRKP